MSAKARGDREEQELKLLGAHQVIMELCVKTPLQRAEKRAAERKLGELEGIWNKLVTSHRLYCKFSSVGLDSEESREFIFAKQKMKEEAVFTIEKALDEDDTAVEEQKVTKLKRTFLQMQKEVEFDLPALEDLSNSALNSEAYEEAIAMLRESEVKVKQYGNLSAQVEVLLEATEATAFAKSSSDTYDKHAKQLGKLRGLLRKKAPVKEEVKPVVAAPHGHGGLGGGNAGAGKMPVKIKPLDCPTWDGRFKTFGRFKKIWSENITPRHEESALHFMLCQALPKSILDNISTLTSSAAEIWNYLDEKYGRSEVVAREIMTELMSLDHKRLGSKFMGKFCTTMLDTHS